MTEAISAAGLVKAFGSFRALDGLDLSVPTGEVHGFLGPNGPGKTTTIRVLLGLLRADAGAVSLLGGDPWRDAVDAAPAPRLRARRRQPVAEAHRRRDRSTCSAGCGATSTRHRRDELVERFELDPTKRARTYSKGNRQKVALVAALASSGRAADPRRADVGPRPADGGGVPALHPRGARRGPHGPALEPHPRRGRGALRPGEHHPRRPDRRVRDARLACASSPAPRSRRDRPAAARGSTGWTGVHGLTHRRATRCASTSTPSTWPRRCSASATPGSRTLVSTPPTLEELFLRHYGDEPAEPTPASTRPSTGERPHRHAARWPGSPSARPGAAAASGSPASSLLVRRHRGQHHRPVPHAGVARRGRRRGAGQPGGARLQRSRRRARHDRRPGRVPGRRGRARPSSGS